VGIPAKYGKGSLVDENRRSGILPNIAREVAGLKPRLITSEMVGAISIENEIIEGS
jgi:hypothetical protein